MFKFENGVYLIYHLVIFSKGNSMSNDLKFLRLGTYTR